MATIDQVTIPTGSASQPSHWMSGTAAPDAVGATGTGVNSTIASSVIYACWRDAAGAVV